MRAFVAAHSYLQIAKHAKAAKSAKKNLSSSLGVLGGLGALGDGYGIEGTGNVLR